MYNQKVIQTFLKPHHIGKIKNSDGVGKVGNVVCGDVMHLYLRVEKNEHGKEIIKDIKFKTFGCAAAIATSNTIADLAKGKTFSQALAINKDKIVRSLGGLPPIKIHCSVLAADALAEAIYDYFIKSKQKVPAILLKQHQRIEQEKKIIEERYKDWVQAEEKMLKD